MRISHFLSGVVQQVIAGFIIIVLPTIILPWWTKMAWPSVLPLPALIILGLFVLAVMLTIYTQVDRWRKRSDKAHTWATMQKQQVSNKTYRNELVRLDGKSFVKCKFENSTFKYDGSAPFDLINTEIRGSKLIASENPGIKATVLLLKELGYLDQKVAIYKEDNL